MPLTLQNLRSANIRRCSHWHAVDSWSSSDWMTAVVGEVGELASLIKMRNRERDGLTGNKFSPTDEQIADEIADVALYLDLLAARLGVDMEAAIVAKFNATSERLGVADVLEVSQ